MEKAAPAQSLWKAILNAVGFKRSYNFILFFIFAGGLFGFTLSRFKYLNLDTFVRERPPGEWYWFQQDFYKTGILLHLATILPCSILIVFQFIPSIRHRLIMFHRINGYIIILLFLTSNVGALMIAPRTFDGTLSIQFGVGLLVMCSTVSVILAYINIRRKQIEQHRAWMLRGMFYMGSIVTIRPLMSILGHIFDHISRPYHVAWSCDKIEYTWNYYGIPVSYLDAYPMCNSSALPPEMKGMELFAPVKADGNLPDPIAIGAQQQLFFELSFWIALFVHMAGVEIYLHLTPREHQRLRVVSYERQSEKKYGNAGSAGLVVQKLGDADPWSPPMQEQGYTPNSG